MNAGKRAITAGLLAGILFAVALFTIDPANGQTPQADLPPTASTSTVPFIISAPTLDPVITFRGDGSVETLHPPLSAIVVTQCALAVALYIQLDATHLMRADPRQSDLFTAVDGKQVTTSGPPIPWDKAYELALKAVLNSHVVLPCDGDQAT